jgi:drug/metabolite transporter (DMT)-like permease
VASLALGVVWLLSGDGWPTRAAWPGILGSGLLWFGLCMVTLNWGERDALRHASAVQVTTFGCFTGTAACLPFADQFLSQLGSAPVSATLQVVYLGLFPTTLGFTTWAYALARTTSGRMGAPFTPCRRSSSSCRG